MGKKTIDASTQLRGERENSKKRTREVSKGKDVDTKSHLFVGGGEGLLWSYS